MALDPRPDGKIVELATYESFIEAEAAVSVLEAAGIKAMRGADDGNSLPTLSAANGYPVLVFEDDLEAARATMTAADGSESDDASEAAD